METYAGLKGSVLFCDDCRRPTVHFTAPTGLPACGFCGATPAADAAQEA